LLDNQRFVGGVGWRQNEQTYDAFAIVNTAIPNTTITLANVYNVNQFTGGDIDGNDHQLYHINNKSIEGLSLSAYFYDLKDFHDTYGLRANGKAQLQDDMSLLYTLEYAKQETDNTASYKTDYQNIELGLSISGITAKAGYELLGSDDGNTMFKTPLATKHAFNGWADVFAGEKRNDGLADTSLTLSTSKYGPKLAVTYHKFDSDVGNTDLGSEIDILVAKKLSKNYSALLKLADYSKGDTGNDVTKVWLQLAATF